MAERGGQVGNKNASKNKLWAETINRALLAEDGRKLRALADRLIDKALEGDVTALKEIGDRMDGKSVQAIEASGPDGEPLIAEIRVTVVDPK